MAADKAPLTAWSESTPAAAELRNSASDVALARPHPAGEADEGFVVGTYLPHHEWRQAPITQFTHWWCLGMLMRPYISTRPPRRPNDSHTTEDETLNDGDPSGKYRIGAGANRTVMRGDRRWPCIEQLCRAGCGIRAFDALLGPVSTASYTDPLWGAAYSLTCGALR